MFMDVNLYGHSIILKKVFPSLHPLEHSVDLAIALILRNLVVFLLVIVYWCDPNYSKKIHYMCQLGLLYGQDLKRLKRHSMS
jgi:hypothetical protein